MKKSFTELLESYEKQKLKGLTECFVETWELIKEDSQESNKEMINEEPDTEQFNKELEDAKKKSEGKIRNKRIAEPAVQGVQVMNKESSESIESLEEKSLTQKEKEHKEDILRALRKRSNRFIGEYGPTKGRSVMYALATKLAKKRAMKESEDLFGDYVEDPSVELIDIHEAFIQLNEEDLAKYSYKDIMKHAEDNGYVVHSTKGKHIKMVHKSGKGVPLAFPRPHKSIHPQAFRNVYNNIRSNAQEHGHEYVPLGGVRKKG